MTIEQAKNILIKKYKEQNKGIAGDIRFGLFIEYENGFRYDMSINGVLLSMLSIGKTEESILKSQIASGDLYPEIQKQLGETIGYKDFKGGL